MGGTKFPKKESKKAKKGLRWKTVKAKGRETLSSPKGVMAKKNVKISSFTIISSYHKSSRNQMRF